LPRLVPSSQCFERYVHTAVIYPMADDEVVFD
jgi:hypothetical protein